MSLTEIEIIDSFDITPNTNLLDVLGHSGYSIQSAIADIIDNSISAKAKSIWVDMDYNDGNPTISIVDDGQGMSFEKLKQASIIAFKNMLEERAINDLGRFSTGINSASASMCDNLYIQSKVDKDIAHTILLDYESMRQNGWILKHFPTSRIVENYVYGQIHFDDLDPGDGKDVFTSSREGIISNDSSFELLLKEIDSIFRGLMDQWDSFRRKHGDNGDPDNQSISPKARKAQEMFNTTLKEMQTETAFLQKGSLVEDWAAELSEEAQFNIPSYTECFISENLLRRYVDYCGIIISDEAKKEADNWRKRECESKEAANISYDIRKSSEDLFYLDMKYLSNLVDKAENNKEAGLSRSAIVYKPIRDAVGHTSIIQPIAKNQLSIEYANIKARLAKLLKEFNEKNKKRNM